MGLYALSFSVGTFLTPVAAGYVLALQGWRWCFRYLLALFEAASAVVLFAGEETLFDRTGLVGDPVDPCAENRGDKRPDTALNRANDGDDDAKKAALQKAPNRLAASPPAMAPVFPTLIWRPLRVLQLPAVLFAGVMISISGFWVSLVIVTQAPVFSAPPYNFGPSTLGLMYLALVIGASAIGTHWAAPCGALVLVGFAVSAAIPVSMGYALDCYPDLSGQTIQATNVMRNLVAGALTFVIPPWIDRQGFSGACATIAAVGFVANGVFILFLVAGKRIRRRTLGLYVRLARG